MEQSLIASHNRPSPARVLVLREQAPSGPPKWNRRAIADLERRLGAGRLDKAFLMFETRLARSQAVLEAAPDDPPSLASEAHALVSAAGMLGFEALCAVSRRAQEVAADGTSCRDQTIALITAIGEARIELARGVEHPDAAEGIGREDRLTAPHGVWLA